MKNQKLTLNVQFDVIIVGSGPAGVNAAYPLVKAGLQVAIIDAGLDSKKKDKELNDLSDVNLSETSNAYDLIRKSSYVFNKTYQLLKIKSEIEIIQSLAKGGLSEVWHGICEFFSEDELKQIGLPADKIIKEYEEIAKRIKLTTETSLGLNSRLILDAAKNKTNLKSIVYSVPLAYARSTSPFIEDLKRHKNFTYIPNQLVTHIQDKTENVQVKSFSINTLKKSTITSKYVILAAGSINTTRILIRSLNLFDYKTTFLTKPYHIAVCLHPRMLFKKNNVEEMPMGQIVISSKETQQGLGTFFIQLYRFSPSAIYKAVKYIPLPKSLSLKFLSFIAPSLVLADIRFPGLESNSKFSLLRKKKDEDVLEISFQESEAELASHKNELKKIAKQLRSLGLFPVKTVSDYATAHYAGGAPFTKIPGKLSTDKNGMLHQASRIYVADSSTWRFLPAKPPTLTIMANASWVGKNVLRKFH